MMVGQASSKRKQRVEIRNRKSNYGLFVPVHQFLHVKVRTHAFAAGEGTHGELGGVSTHKLVYLLPVFVDDEDWHLGEL